MVFRIILLFAIAAECGASNWYCSTNGTGDGTLGSPWHLQTALTNAAVQAGDTVWLRSGTYFPILSNSSYLLNSPGWQTTPQGASNNVVTYRSYTGEWAKIDRRWLLSAYIRFQDLEFFDSLKGQNPDTDRPDGKYAGPWGHFVPNQAGDEWINCVIHDVHGVWGDKYSKVRGCIVWYSGWNDLEHVSYPDVGTFSGNIVGWAHNRTLNNSDVERAYTVTSNIIWGSGMVVGGGAASLDIVVGWNSTVVGNVTLNTNAQSMQLAFTSGATASNNIVLSGGQPVVLSGYSNNVFSGNTVYALAADHNMINFSSGNPELWTVDGNAFHTRPAHSPLWILGGTYGKTWTDWKALGFDATGTTNNAAPADTVRVMVNADQAKRAHIAVINWSQADNVNVDVSNVLSSGDTYSLYSAQNYNAGAIKTGTYSGTPISVPMTNLTVATILYGKTNIFGTTTNHLGETFSEPPVTSPEFAAFVLIGAAPETPRYTHSHGSGTLGSSTR